MTTGLGGVSNYTAFTQFTIRYVSGGVAKRMRAINGIVLLALALPAYSDQAFEAITHTCDSANGKYQLKYEVSWNSPWPQSPDIIAVPGEHKRSCRIGALSIDSDIRLYQPRGRGECGGVPGGQVNSLRIDGKEVLKDIDFNMVKLLLENGASVNGISKKRMTPLIAATVKNHDEIVSLLLERKANPNIRTDPLPQVPNDKGVTALSLARKLEKTFSYNPSSDDAMKNKRIIELLTKAGAVE